MSNSPRDQPITARQWHDSFAAPVVSLSRPVVGARVSRFTNTGQESNQPALADHILCLHLGGPKRVRRSLGVPTRDFAVEERALTIMPAGQSNRWLTTGPIDFAHLTLETAQLDRIAEEEFDLAPRTWELADRVGLRDPLIERLFGDLLITAARQGRADRLYPQSLMTVLATRLVGEHAIGPHRGLTRTVHRGGLADWRLKRVIEFMREKMAEDIDLEDLTAVSGLSRAQFFRAFKQSTGASPHKYLTTMRMERVGEMMRLSRMTVEQAVVAAGLKTGSRFNAAFRRRYGANPQKIGWK